MSKTIVNVFSHNFSVHGITPVTRQSVQKFLSWFDETEWVEKAGGWSKEWIRSYAARTGDRKEFRFHINALPAFKALLAKDGVGDKDITFIVEPDYEPDPINLPIQSTISPYPEQVPILEQLKEEDPVSKLLGLQMGGGKSLLSIITSSHWKYRTVFLMKPGYIKKWEKDVCGAAVVVKGDVISINGLKELALLITGIESGRISPKVVLISNATFRYWIVEHEKLDHGEYVPGFDIHPHEFMQACGFGFRVIDEVHQDFHANFKFDLYTHIAQSLSLSATLVTRNEFLAKMHKLAYPLASRCVVPEFKKYTKVVAWFYDFVDDRFLNTSARGRSSYSHVEFEKSIMRSTRIKKAYFMMWYDLMRQSYLRERKVGERCLVYFATREMCNEAKFFFKQLMPGFKIEKFNQGDPYSNLVESDICFATLMKAGTAVDIPNLTTVIMTIAVDSIQANEQALGRLRDLLRLYGNPRIPEFYYGSCMNILKHMVYHRSKQELFKTKALVSTEMRYRTSIA